MVKWFKYDSFHTADPYLSVTRDLKTANIFLTNDGVVKIGDFGISKMLTTGGKAANTLVGTPYYISPEMVRLNPTRFTKLSVVISLVYLNNELFAKAVNQLILVLQTQGIVKSATSLGIAKRKHGSSQKKNSNNDFVPLWLTVLIMVDIKCFGFPV
mgnify:CR=1 FL=1